MRKLITLTIAALALSLFLIIPSFSTHAVTDEQKVICGNLIRHGKEELQRKKFNRAKKFLREAIQVDPANKIAWKYYDQAVIFALAAKVRVDDSLTRIDTDSAPATDTVQPTQEPKEDTASDNPSDESEEDDEEEGC